MWECPDFYPVSARLENATLEKHILKVSLTGTHDAYTTGNYNTSSDVFIPDSDFRLRYDYGKFYASKTFYDSERGGRILWGWVNESLSSKDYIAQGWSGVQAIPREIWLDKSGKQLMQWPVPEVEKLRGKKAGFANRLLKSGSTLEIIGITPAQADVGVLFSVPKSQLKEAEYLDKNWTDPRLLCSQMDASKKGSLGPFGLKVLASKDMQEYTAIFLRIFKVQKNKYTVLMYSDQSRSSLNPKPDKTPYGVFLNVDPLQGHLPLRVLVDNSIVESFGAKGEACITSRVYPTKALREYAGLYLFNNGVVNISVSSLSAWSMKKALLDLKS